MGNLQKCINFAVSNKTYIFTVMDKESLLQYWAGELIAVKMELEKISFLLQSGITPNRALTKHLDDMLDRKKHLEMLIEEIRNHK